MIDRDIALVDELRAGNEHGQVEFKKNNSAPKLVGKLCSALSNAARIANQETAYVLWGIDNETHNVVGTTFNFDKPLEGNQVFQLWLAQQLKPSIAFSFREVAHPDGRVVLLEIPAALLAPVEFSGIAYLRIGSATPKLADYPDRYQVLINNLRPYIWEKGIAKSYISADDVLLLLDYPSYFKLTEQNLPDNKAGILERLAGDDIIKPDVGGQWNVTNLGAILFATDLERFDHLLARKGVRFVAYKGKNRAANVTHRQDGKKGYACAFEGLVGYLNDLLPNNEHIAVALRADQPLFPEIAIRELVANALIHQDMTIQGTGPLITQENHSFKPTV